MEIRAVNIVLILECILVKKNKSPGYAKIPKLFVVLSINNHDLLVINFLLLALC